MSLQQWSGLILLTKLNSIMAFYNVINPETGETKVVECPMQGPNDILNWYENNPGWERDWTHGSAGISAGVGDWKTKNVNKNRGWKDVLDKVRKVPGNTLDKNNLY